MMGIYCIATKCVIYYTKPVTIKLKRATVNLKEKTMFSFEEQYKKFEELSERTKQAYDFWYNCIMSTFKDFCKKK